MTKNSLEDFLAHVPIGFYRLDAQDRVAYANAAWLELHGYTSLDQVHGKNIQFAYARSLEAEQLKTKIVAEGTVKDAIHELKRPDGQHFWASIYSTQLTDDTGHYAG
ncbi:MAG TPA: PAS domain-containing protein, partial [Ardenticatenaceae bacterium]